MTEDKGVRAGSRGRSQQAVSAVPASIPDTEEIPSRASIYPRPLPAITALAEAVGCDGERASELLRAIIEAGYFIAPRAPTDAMLSAYFTAYGMQAWSPKTIVQNIGKARLRWLAMGQAGTAAALSRKFLDAQGTEAGTDETEGLGPQGDGPVRDSECARPSPGDPS